MAPPARPQAALLLLAAGALFLACAPCLAGPQAQPLRGQGLPPEEPKKIFVTALMERLLGIDETNYRFENVLTVYLSWEDSRAMDAMTTATEALRNGTKETCELSCDGTGSKLTRETAGVTEFCCDGVWLPTVNLVNIYGLPTSRTEEYGIEIQGDKVARFAVIHANWYSPMNFRNFPFDSQKLTMQFRSPHNTKGADPVSEFVESATSTRWMVSGDGDIVSGWEVKQLEVLPQRKNMQRTIDFYVGTFGNESNPEDPFPVALKSKDQINVSTSSGNKDDIEDIEGYQRGGDSYANQFTVGFDVVITVERFWSYFIVTTFIPILILALLSLITYFIPPEHLTARFQLNVTFILSITALQIVINNQLPRSSYPTSVTQLVVLCYMVVAFAIPESLLVYTLAKRAEKMEKQRQSQASMRDAEQLQEGEGWRSPSHHQSRHPSRHHGSVKLIASPISRRVLAMHRDAPLLAAQWIDRGCAAGMVVVISVAAALVCVY